MYIIGPRIITSLVEKETYFIVHLLGVPNPLFWPKEIPLYHLYMVITECFQQRDWHYYEVPETEISPGDVVLDCGAAEGLFSLRAIEKAGHVVLFEPSPAFVSSLRMTFADMPKVDSSADGSWESAWNNQYDIINSIVSKVSV